MNESSGDDVTRDHLGEPLGSAAEEAARLLAAVAEWGREQGSEWGTALGGLAGQAAAAAHDVDAHLATGSEECRYCPVCRAVQLYRSASPEVRAHLTTAGTSLAQAAASLLATGVPERRGAGVERIDLDADQDAVQWPGEDEE